MSAVDAALLVPGFDEPVARAQQVFRGVLAAMACPGRVLTLETALAPLPPLQPAALGVALTVLDADTPVWLDAAADRPAVRANLRFHCGCPLASKPGAAAFALIAGAAVMPALAAFRVGNDCYPDRSATLIVQVAALDRGERFTLAGPGIERDAHLAVSGLPEDFAAQWAANHRLYPAGVDLILAAGRRIAALPRSTRLEAG